jgi:cellulose biosynthesis protein BcsQ
MRSSLSHKDDEQPEVCSMKLVTFASFKGGAGKTTALMAVCSSFAEQGKRIALLEADPNAPLQNWRDDARRIGTWNESCTVFLADTPSSLESSVSKAETEGYEFALIDTQGGGSELNNSIVANSNIIVVPSAPSPLDIDLAIDTIDYILKLCTAESIWIPVAILLQRIPMTRMTKSMEADLLLLSSLPQYTTQMHERDAFRTIKTRGMLHPLYRKLAANPTHRIGAGHVRKAMDEADSLANELVEIMQQEAADAN